MSGNSVFELVGESGRTSGLRNLLRADFGKWFRTRLWWTQSLIWIGVINGILASILWGTNRPPGVEEGLMLYSIFTALFPAIAVVIILQDAIVGEREAGTAAWVLSKPVARASFVLSKLFPNMIGVLVTMLILPGIVAYAQLSIANGAPLDLLRFIAALGIFWIYTTYFLTLTLMLGTFFKHRAPVIGIPLALAFGQQMLLGLSPFFARILPWTIAMPVGNEPSIVSSVLMNTPLPDMLPLYITTICIFIFVIAAVLRFEKEEF